MPELSAVAAHFDDIDIVDGYTLAKLFKGQVSSFNETSPDGNTNKKRTISVVPGTIIPARRLISYFGENWLIGDGNTDGLQNRQLRTAYWTRKVVDTAFRLSPAEACKGLTGFALASSKEYLKDTVNSVSDSEYDPQWDITISITESAVKGQFLKIDNKYYRIRSVHTTASGFLVANCDELDGTPRTAVRLVIAGEVDPITETRIQAYSDTFGILFDPSKLYRFISQADPRYLSGDMTLILALPASVGSVVSLSGIDWRVLTCTPELDGFSLHIRRA
jgi:hypothetical protein